MARAAPCAIGSLDSYIALGATGCEVGDASFRGFTLDELPFGATGIPASGVLVTPLSADLLSPGLSFEVNRVAKAGELFEILIAYEVAAPAIGGAALEIEGASATVDGAATASEELCLGGTFGLFGCLGTLETLAVFDVGLDAERAVALSFAPVAALVARKDIAIDGGLEGGAGLVRAINRFVLPEPASALLLGTGLFALALRRVYRH